MRRGQPALIRDREVDDLHFRRGPFFPYRCAGDRPVAREFISLKALGKEECINQTHKTDENIAFKCNLLNLLNIVLYM